VLGAWRAERLVGSIGCERDRRRKGRHVGHIVGMMVRPEARGKGIGRDLLQGLIGECRRIDSLEMLTLSVTAGNVPAVSLYESSGFSVYGNLRRAVRLDNGQYHDKLHMVLWL
jgi:ribosomal protein S18 acetylase RimI-like enzyme